MYDLQDLPYGPGLQDMPNTFTPFRNKVEKNCKIRAPLTISKGLGTFPEDTKFDAVVDKYSAEMPSLKDLGYTSDQIEHANFDDPRGVMAFKGGETAALARVKDYIWDKDLLRKYFDTRNGMIGADYSTKFSPWLAHGNLSPRYVAKECKKYEDERVANKSTYCKFQRDCQQANMFSVKSIHQLTYFSPNSVFKGSYSRCYGVTFSNTLH